MKVVYNLVEIRNGKLVGVSSFDSLKTAEERFQIALKACGLKERFDGYANDGEYEIALTHNEVNWKVS